MEGVALQGKIQRILAMLSPEYFNYKDNVLLEYEQQERKQSLLSKNMKIDYLQTFSFPGGTVVKNMPVNAEDVGSIPGWGRNPGEGNGNPLQYSCLENPMDRAAWRATVYGVTKSRTWLRTECAWADVLPFKMEETLEGFGEGRLELRNFDNFIVKGKSRQTLK